MTETGPARPSALLVDEVAVRAFLRTQSIADPDRAAVTFLPGGVSSIVVRVESPTGCVVIKQALPKLKVQADWYSRPERSAIEVRCAQLLERLVPGSVPDVIAEYPEANAFSMACAPSGTSTWKDLLLQGQVDLDVAYAVGVLAGRIRAASSGDAETAAALKDQSFFRELRIDPFLRPLSERYPDLAQPLGEVREQLTGPGSCLVHGDFSPKNLLVTPAGHLLLVDHEVAHWGHPAFDLAFVLAHLCLKYVHLRASRRAVGDGIRRLLGGYVASSGSEHPDPLTGRLVAILMLARVDGKSPVEYLAPADGERVRSVAFESLRDPSVMLTDVLNVLASE